MYVKNPYSETKQNLLREVDMNPRNEVLQRQLEEITDKEHSWIQSKLEQMGISLKDVKYVIEEVRDNKESMSKSKQYQESLKLWKLARELVRLTKTLKDEIRIRNTGSRR